MYDINEICEKVNGVFSKKICLKITRISSLKSAKENEISFFSDLKYFNDLKQSKASAFLVSNSLKNKVDSLDLNFIFVKDITIATNAIIDLIMSKNKNYEINLKHETTENFVKGKNCFIDSFVKINSNSKIYAAFAISNFFHKQGKFKESAKLLKIANEESIKNKKSDSNLKIKHTEFYRSLKIKNSKNKFLKNPSNYVFIVGMPRSGSTLLENILSLNSEVADMGEVNFLEESVKETKDFEDVYDLYEKKELNQFKSSFIYTDKSLFNYIYCPIISNFFPNAKIINCIRNPLDNILSIYRANFLKQSFSFSLLIFLIYICSRDKASL